MSDGSIRIGSVDGKYPTGYLTEETFGLPITASPGIHEEQPAVVPFSFNSEETTAPAGYETIPVDSVFASYNWDEQEQLANWEANLVCNGVVITRYTFVNDDSDISVFIG